MTKIIFSLKASTQLTEQAQYIYERSQSAEAADKYLDEMKNFIIEMLSHFPKAGRISEELAPMSRKLVYQGYSIIYRIRHDIEILAIYRENLLH